MKKVFISSLLVVMLLSSLLVPAHAGDIISWNKMTKLTDMEGIDTEDPNYDAVLPELPNSKTLRLNEGSNKLLKDYSGVVRVLPVTLTQCSYENYSTTNPNKALTANHLEMTLATGGSIRFDYTRCGACIVDVPPSQYENVIYGFDGLKGRSIEKFGDYGIVVTDANVIGTPPPGCIETCDANINGTYHNYGKGLTLTFTKPGSYYMYLGDFDSTLYNFVVTVQGDAITTPTNPTTTPSDTQPDTQSFTAKATSSTVYIDGKAVSFEAYNIKDNNYFKLRDIAFALKGTNAQFNVTWDGQKQLINVYRKTPYSIVGGEMKIGDGKDKKGILSTSEMLCEGTAWNPVKYNINNNNFVKLRDIGKQIGFDVTWDGSKNAIMIDTNAAYTDD